MLTQIKKELRITGNAFDDEINRLIIAARADLTRVGIQPFIQDTDAQTLLESAIVFYCKAHFGYDNPDHEKNVRTYHAIKTSLALDSRVNS